MKRFFAFFLCLSFLLNPLLLQANETEEYLKRSDRAEKWVFEDLPRHVGNDFKETFWNPWHLAALAGGAGLIVGLHEKDTAIRDAFQPNRPFGKTFDDIMDIGGNPIVLGSVALATFGISELVDAKKTALTSGTMLEALALTETLTLGLKFATGRKRPDGSSNSFPSAHASGAFALASVVEVFYGPLYGIPSYALATLIAVSRLDTNKHFASDVAAGALLGTLIGLGTAKFHKKEFSNFFLVPEINKESAALMLVHRF